LISIKANLYNLIIDNLNIANYKKKEKNLCVKLRLLIFDYEKEIWLENYKLSTEWE